MKDEIMIYTDGACSGNPGEGGWGVVVIWKDKIKEGFGYEPATTNNRMELTAAIRALQMLKRPCKVTIHSDSAYLVNAFSQKWIDSWVANGWQTKSNKPVINQDLWQSLLDLMSIHDVCYKKVRGHSTDEYNNRCDFLARTAISCKARA